MDGPQLLHALMQQAGDTGLGLAKKVGLPKLQPNISKFIRRVSLEPERKTLLPVAQHYGVPVDAFYDGELADQVAEARGLAATVAVAHVAPPVDTKLRNAISELDRAIKRADDLQIASLEPLFLIWISRKVSAGTISHRIFELLTKSHQVVLQSQNDRTEGKDNPPENVISQPKWNQDVQDIQDEAGKGTHGSR